MKAREIIAMLSTMPQDAEVLMVSPTHDFALNIVQVSQGETPEIINGEETMVTCVFLYNES